MLIVFCIKNSPYSRSVCPERWLYDEQGHVSTASPVISSVVFWGH